MFRPVRVTSGEFVVQLDQDDAFLPGRLEAIAAVLRARPDVDVVASDGLVEMGGRDIVTLEAISRYRGTTSGGPNFAYELCVRKATPEALVGLDLASWRVAFNGAEPVRAETLERFAEAFAPAGFRPEAFYPCYGLAEATLFVAGGLPGRRPRVTPVEAAALERNDVVILAPEVRDARRLVSSGRPWMKRGSNQAR